MDIKYDEKKKVKNNQAVYVNLSYDEIHNNLPLDKWDLIVIMNLTDNQSPEREAIAFALEELNEDPTSWPSYAYTSLIKPKVGTCVTKHSLNVA